MFRLPPPAAPHVQNLPDQSLLYTFNSGVACKKTADYTYYAKGDGKAKVREIFDASGSFESKWQSIRPVNPDTALLDAVFFDICFDYGQGLIDKKKYDEKREIYEKIRERRLSTTASSHAPGASGLKFIRKAEATLVTENRDGIKCNGRTPCSPDGNWFAALATLLVKAAPGQELRGPDLACSGNACPWRADLSVGVSPDAHEATARVLTWSLPVTLKLTVEVWGPAQ